MKDFTGSVKAAITEALHEQLAEPLSGGRIPRPDQIAVAAEAIHSLAEREPNDKGTIIEMPTGGGKTATAMVIIRWLIEHLPQAKVAFMVHRRELFAQTLDQFKKEFGASRIDVTEGSRDTHKPNARVRVMMEQTLASKDKANQRITYHNPDACWEFPRVDVLFVDEAHSMNYQSFLGVFRSYGTAMLGLSATPDDWRLRQFWKPAKILGISQAELEERGTLVEPTFYTPEGIRQIARLVEMGGSGAPTGITFEDALMYVVPEIRRVEEEIGKELKWIVKTQSKVQARAMAKWLVDNQIPARAFWSGQGGGKKADIDSILDGSNPKIRVAVVVQRFSVGYDSPYIGGIVLTGEMKFSLFVQTVGRALRPGHPRVKSEAYIIDLAGNLPKYLDRYMERRSDPNPIIPERVVREPREDIEPPEPKPPEKELDFELILHEVKLSNLEKTSAAIADAEIFAYCAVLAEREAGAGEENAKARAKRCAANAWMLMRKATGGRNKMRRAIMNNPRARAIWIHRCPMPAKMWEELLNRRREYAAWRAAGGGWGGRG